ncbi:MAG TPA: NAD(P)-dependent oxidoreductase [Actinobacteria bacterium]|nr:NAD(P)-dependent oxidoreductase [Actinomycetota bacterium]
MTRILVLGSGGMLGHKVLQRLSTEHTVVGTLRGAPGAKPYGAIPLFRDGAIVGGVDAADVSTVSGAIEASRPDVVVNCIGVIKQKDRDPEANIAINALFPHRLVAHCSEHGIRVIHFSTDCVFNGRRGSYAEDDISDAEDLYGRTKYLGEVADSEHVLTLRTSLVGRELTEFHSLLEWFLSQRGRVKGFRRAFFSGVTTNWMADLVARLITEHPGVHGRYQVAGPRISKFDLLGVFAKAFGHKVEIVPEDEFLLDRSLIGDRFTADTGLKAPSWEDMVAVMAADPTPYEEWR